MRFKIRGGTVKEGGELPSASPVAMRRSSRESVFISGSLSVPSSRAATAGSPSQSRLVPDSRIVIDRPSERWKKLPGFFAPIRGGTKSALCTRVNSSPAIVTFSLMMIGSSDGSVPLALIYTRATPRSPSGSLSAERSRSAAAGERPTWRPITSHPARRRLQRVVGRHRD